MGHPMVPVGKLEILFSVTPHGGYNFGKTKKFQLPHVALDKGRNPFVAPFAAFCAFFENFGTFLNGPSGARPVNRLAS